MLSIATLNPSTPFNHSPGCIVRRILNRHSLLPSTFSLPSKSNPYCSSSSYRPLRVRAIDAAQLFDYESKLAKEFTISQPLKIAISPPGPHRPRPLPLRPLCRSQKAWRIVLPKPRRPMRGASRSDPPLLLHNLNGARAPHAPSPAPQA
ncbi:hypothetical protein HN51_052084 [Arachis hypogaea]|nr:Arogenate dehydrogenase 2 [Arachis hypogaea]